ncbi:MAG: hypothetical protein AB1416_09390 [Actinomycetota bacterium]
MRTRHRLVRLGATLAAAAVPLAVAPAATPATAAPVATVADPSLGRILATPGKFALYTWSREKAGTIRCTGACAKAWPPLTVRSAAKVPRRVAGVKGTFGTIRRPGGALQVTHNGKALYTYRGDPRGIARCNNVDGWFAVKVR